MVFSQKNGWFYTLKMSFSGPKIEGPGDEKNRLSVIYEWGSLKTFYDLFGGWIAKTLFFYSLLVVKKMAVLAFVLCISWLADRIMYISAVIKSYVSINTLSRQE